MKKYTISLYETKDGNFHVELDHIDGPGYSLETHTKLDLYESFNIKTLNPNRIRIGGEFVGCISNVKWINTILNYHQTSDRTSVSLGFEIIQNNSE